MALLLPGTFMAVFIIIHVVLLILALIFIVRSRSTLTARLLAFAIALLLPVVGSVCILLKELMTAKAAIKTS